MNNNLLVREGSTRDDDFDVIPVQLPNYLLPENLVAVADNVAMENLKLLSGFSSGRDKNACLQVKDKSQRLALNANNGWVGCSWKLQDRQNTLKVIAASFEVLNKMTLAGGNKSFAATKADALAGLEELTKVIETFWRDKDISQDARALKETLSQKPLESLDEEIQFIRNSPDQNHLSTDRREVNTPSPRQILSDYAQMETESESPVDSFWSCIKNVPLSSFRSNCSPCCFRWCGKWLKPVANME